MSQSDPIFSKNGTSFFFQSKREGWNPDLTSELAKFIGRTKRSLDCANYDLPIWFCGFLELAIFLANQSIYSKFNILV